MLRNISLVGLVLTFCFGCKLFSGADAEKTVETTKPAEAANEVKYAVGDRVVAKWSGNSFYEGLVEEIESGRVTVKWNDGSNASKVDETYVYPIPKSGNKPNVSVGDMVLAKTGNSTYWNGAEVTKVDEGTYGVKTVERGKTANVDGNQIIEISSATAANLRDKGDANSFLKEAYSKKPEISSDYKAKKGDRVLAQWATNSWYSGKVTKAGGDNITVAWEDGSKPSAVGSDRVMAYPDAKNVKAPIADQYVLAKPESGSKWGYAKVVSVNGNGIELKDSKGVTRTVKTGECVPLS